MAARVFYLLVERGICAMKNPAIKVAMWMILLLAVIWLLGWVLGYNGIIEEFHL
jgi:hypothetical protein